MTWDSEWRGAPCGISGGAPTGRLVSIIFSPDAVLMGCERQHGEFGILEVACHGCDRKDAAAATKGSIFEAKQGSILLGPCVFTGAEE